jgi:ATP-dependent protease ClpP protease subunit
MDSSSSSENLAFWRGLKDHEFYGPRLKHVYFYGNVDDESVTKLRKEVLEACKGVKDDKGVWSDPKPIVMHVHSQGGSVYSEQWLLSLFNQVQVPLCAMVDALSASAATAITVMAPYRVATEHSLTLIHDYSNRPSEGTREQLIDMLARAEADRKTYVDLYLSRTKIPRARLEEILRRDMWLDAPTCLRMGIYDRVIKPNRRTVTAKVRGLAPFSVSNWNTVFATCLSTFPSAFDEIMSKQEELKPVVIITPGGEACNASDPLISLAMIARILSSPVPVFGVIDNVVSWWQLLPILFCHRRFMYENARLDSDLAYERTWGSRLQDIVHNAGVMRGLITGTVKARAKPSAELLADMFDRNMTLSAQECLKHGLVDEVVRLSAASGYQKAKGVAPKPKAAAKKKTK